MESDNFIYHSGKDGELMESHPGKPSNIDNIKHVIAEKLDYLAGELSAKADSPGAQPAVAGYGKDVSHLLERSADYVRNFDYEGFESDVRSYVSKNPGASLLMAGAAGLIIGAILRKR
jgi:ElaB/YqjD/DUF883 family membrane-anchored ribosome-binding protein